MQQIRDIEKVNVKLCQIMRVPSDFIDVEKDDEEEEVEV